MFNTAFYISAANLFVQVMTVLLVLLFKNSPFGYKFYKEIILNTYSILYNVYVVNQMVGTSILYCIPNVFKVINAGIH